MHKLVKTIPRLALRFCSPRTENIVSSLSVARGRCYSTNDNSFNQTNQAITANSTLRNMSQQSILRGTPISEKHFNDFQALFPDIVEDIVQSINASTGKETAARFKWALEYNLGRSLKDRSILLILAYERLAKELTPTNLRLAQILGWCMDLHQTFLVNSDDILDGASIRKNSLCWHRVEGVGLTSLYDYAMFDQCVYYLLQKHLGHLECYITIVEIFHEMAFISNSSESLDMLNNTQSVATFTREKYRYICMGKTGYYAYYMPVIMAMHLAGCKDVNAFREVKPILLELGSMVQIYDDYLDAFGAVEDAGKLPADIKNNKCSWVAVECMHRANDEQRAIMLECYGKDDPEKIARVNQLYIDMKLDVAFFDYEKEVYNKIRQSLQQTSDAVPKDFILEVVQKNFHRYAL